MELWQKSAELIEANKNLLSQNAEKEKLAAALAIANMELLFQNEEKEKRAAELAEANKELIFQNQEKEKRAAELAIANKELVFQNQEKEKRAAELAIANEELIFQIRENRERSAELAIANKELIFQSQEREKRAAELVIANKELEQFAYIASHDLQEPLRTISNYIQVLDEDYSHLLDESARKYLRIVNDASKRMSVLIISILNFARIGKSSKLNEVDCNNLLADVVEDLKTIIEASNTKIEIGTMPKMNVFESEVRQLFQNLIVNAIKFQKKDNQPKIQITSEQQNEYWKFVVIDNGIGIDPDNFQKIFDIFQRLHNNERIYTGTGIGLANCKKIAEMHHGQIWVETDVTRGTIFNFTLKNIIQ